MEDTALDFSGSLIDHVNLAVSDIDRSRAFYEPTLASIGIVLAVSVPAERAANGAKMFGFGWSQKPFFWIVGSGVVGGNTHVAFTVPNRAAVDAFYEAAIGAGGVKEHEPQLWFYHPNYYGAFVTDPDGISVEAVCHFPE